MFTYSVPTAIHFGEGMSRNIPSLLPACTSGKRVFLVTDPGILKAGLIERFVSDLEGAGYAVHVFSQVAQNPRDTDCQVGAGAFRDVSADIVLGVGGGSAMDTAKAIALLAPNGGTPLDYAEGRRAYENIVPIVCVPTTAGTGSEVTRSSVITEAATHRKLTLKHANLRPKLAILDPLLTRTVPPAVTAATGVDALVHAIEGYTCRLSSPMTRAFGAAAMRVIVPALPKAFRNGEDIAARTAMLEGSLLAGMCFGSSDVAAVHCLAEALGSVYDTPHGIANSIFLPEVLRFNASADIPLHAEIARHMGLASDTDAPETAVKKMLQAIQSWTKELGIPTLHELGYVNPSDFDRIVALSVANNSTPSNVRSIDSADYRTILNNLWTNKLESGL